MVVDAYGGIWIVDPALVAILLTAVVMSFLLAHAGLFAARRRLMLAGQRAARIGRSARRRGLAEARRPWRPGLRGLARVVLPRSRGAGLLPAAWRTLARGDLALPARRALP